MWHSNRQTHRQIHYLLIYLLTYLLTPWCRVLLEKLTGLQLVKKFPAFHGTRRFITALTSVPHLSLSWASPIQSIYPHPTSWRSILILSTHLRLGFPSGNFPSGFPTKILYTPLSPTICATCPARLILLDWGLINIKPAAKLNALTRTQKKNEPVRPHVNSTKAPSYKIAKYLNKMLNYLMNLSYSG